MIGTRQRNNAWFIAAFMLVLTSVTVGCGDEDTAAQSSSVTETTEADEVDFGQPDSVVVVGDKTYIVSGDTSGDCVQIEGDCIDLSDIKGERYCDDPNAQADVIVVNGEVVDVICYPSPDSGQPVETVTSTDGNVELGQGTNGAVVTFDESTNGVPIEGNLIIDGERTIIYGNGVDETIFEGNLEMASNNARVRGVTIKGNVTYANNSNNGGMSFVKIHGNLSVSSNGFSIFDARVFGNVEVSGNDATLINIGVQGGWDVPRGATCDGCYSFKDEDADFVVADGERGDALTCGGGGGN